MTRKKIIATAFGVSILILAFWALRPKPIPAEIVEVRVGKFEQVIVENARTRARDRYIVSAPVGGQLSRITLKAGARVSRGSVVATIVPPLSPLVDARSEQELEARLGAGRALVSQARASRDKSKAALENSTRDFKRVKALWKAKLVAKSEYEDSQTDLRSKQEDYEGAQSEVRRAEKELAAARAALLRARESLQEVPEGRGAGIAGRELEIPAPVDGVVLRVIQESEAVVAAGAALLELAADRGIEIVTEVLTSQAVAIRPGARVAIENWGGPGALQGKVRLVEPGAFTKISALGVEEQRVNVIVDFVSPLPEGKSLGDGYRVETRIATFLTEGVTLVPTAALFLIGGDWRAYQVIDGRARSRVVRLGPRNPESAIVQSGLKAGDRVILYPGDEIHDGVRIK